MTGTGQRRIQGAYRRHTAYKCVRVKSGAARRSVVWRNNTCLIIYNDDDNACFASCLEALHCCCSYRNIIRLRRGELRMIRKGNKLMGKRDILGGQLERKGKELAGHRGSAALELLNDKLGGLVLQRGIGAVSAVPSNRGRFVVANIVGYFTDVHRLVAPFFKGASIAS